MQNLSVEVWFSLHVPYDTGSIPLLYWLFFITTVFCIFPLFLPQWLIFLFFFHIEILIKTSSLNLTNLCVVPRIVMHLKIGDICLSFY